MKEREEKERRKREERKEIRREETDRKIILIILLLILLQKIICYLLFVLSCGYATAQGSTFVFTNTGTNAQMDTALNYTGRIWGKFLNSTIPNPYSPSPEYSASPY